MFEGDMRCAPPSWTSYRHPFSLIRRKGIALGQELLLELVGHARQSYKLMVSFFFSNRTVLIFCGRSSEMQVILSLCKNESYFSRSSMGGRISSEANIAENLPLKRLTGEEAISDNDPFWNNLFSFNLNIDDYDTWVYTSCF